MLHERRTRILDMIAAQRTVKVSQLTKEFDVSIETVRRDLEYLERHGHLQRVYGGAVLSNLYGQEPVYEHRETARFPQKRAIGARAAQLLDDGDTLFVDVGTTTLEVVKCLQSKKDVTVITNASLIAQAAVAAGCRVVMLGGEMRRGELSVSGFLCDAGLQYFHANKAVLGVGGITLSGGVTDYHAEEANVRRTMIRRADRIIAVADSSKFGVTAMNEICPVEKLDFLVTDWTLPAKVAAQYAEKGPQLVVADSLD